VIQAKQHSSLWIALLHIVFFVSGFSGLAYQVVWIRKFGFVFGVTAFATSAVLTAFFAGLALGSWLAGRRARFFARNPLQVYALFETGIGAYALAIPFLLDSLNQVYAFVYPSLENSVYLLTLLRLFFSIVVLILPTTLMGATLPLITQALAERVTNITVNLSGLYAINTFGALAGAAFSGFYSIGAFGMSETTLIAVAGNFLAGIGAWLIARRCALAPGAPRALTIATRATGGKYRALLLGLFLGGFVSLGSEVVWTRVLSLFMDRTVFAYTTILCAALFGIVIGSWLLRVGQQHIRRPLRVLALLELGIAWISFLSIALISQAVPSQGDWGIPLSLGLILLIPNALSGAALPLAVRVYQDEFKNVAQSVGDLYSTLSVSLRKYLLGHCWVCPMGARYSPELCPA
jgi:spermidine synthase